MARRRSTAELHDPEALETAWPELVAPRDPMAGDERLADPADPADLLAHGGQGGGEVLSEAEFTRWDEAFLSAYAAVLDGRAPWGATDAAARAMALDHPRRHDSRPPRCWPSPIDDRDLADIVEDRTPDVRLVLERVLGPFADGPLPRRARCAGAAVLGKLPALRHGSRVYDRVLKDKPKPESPVRARLRAVSAAPAMLWARDGAGLRPLLPLARLCTPVGPVQADLGGCPAALGMAIAGPDHQGWSLAGCLPLPVIPDPVPILRRLDLEMQRLRRHDRRLTWEDLLSSRPEVLYRTACEWTWTHADRAAVLAAWGS